MASFELASLGAAVSGFPVTVVAFLCWRERAIPAFCARDDAGHAGLVAHCLPFDPALRVAAITAFDVAVIALLTGGPSSVAATSPARRRLTRARPARLEHALRTATVGGIDITVVACFAAIDDAVTADAAAV
jgi:hypothetical protein